VALLKIEIKPMPHQIDGIRHMEAHNYRTILADDMGLGKTIQVMGLLHRNPHLYPAVVVCPSSVKYNWRHEALQFGVSASVCEGRTPPTSNSFLHTDRPRLTIINYEILEEWLPTFMKWGVRSAVFDECHWLGDPDSSRTVACMKLASRCDGAVLGLSGTPMNKAPIEMWPVLQMVWPGMFGSRHTYAQRYCRPRLTPWGWKYDGAANMRELKDRLTKAGLLRRTKAILNLPPKTRSVEVIKLSDEDMREYQFAKNHFLKWVQKRHPDRLSRVKKVQDLAKIGYLMRMTAEMKLDGVIETCRKWRQANPTKKLILMAVHRPVIKRLCTSLGGMDSYVQIDGSSSGQKRFDLNYKFQHDPKTWLCVANMKAAGMGINLTASHTIFFVELWWNPATHQQAEDRAHRIGQDHEVDIRYLLADDTIEGKCCSLLQKRQHATGMAIDGQERPTFNIYEELAKEMAANRGGFKL
jgi:SWI/SNF-related matrix-associated actin-dependent regulator 1 of chromatin subfamily A